MIQMFNDHIWIGKQVSNRGQAICNSKFESVTWNKEWYQNRYDEYIKPKAFTHVVSTYSCVSISVMFAYLSGFDSH